MRWIGLAVVLALGLALAPLAAGAQQTEKVRRIGFLAGTNRLEPYNALRHGLREHGYVEGQNLRIEWRVADGRTDRIAGLAAELISLNVEAIVAVAPDFALAAKESDPVDSSRFHAALRSGRLGSRLEPGAARWESNGDNSHPRRRRWALRSRRRLLRADHLIE